MTNDFKILFNNLNKGEQITTRDYTFTSGVINNVKVIKVDIQEEIEIFDLVFINLENLYNWLYEREDIRICVECGKPMQEGYTDDGGSFYCCSDEEFENIMNRTYGVGKWREESTKNADWFYEYLSANGEWQDEPSYWTEWYTF